MVDIVTEAKAIQATIQGLLDRVSALEDMIGLGDDDVTLIMRSTGLTRNEAKVVSLLRKRRVAYTHEMIFDAIYGGLPECDRPGPKVVHVMMNKIRLKLRALGLAVDTVRQVGYMMAEPDRVKLTAMMGALLQGPRIAA